MSTYILTARNGGVPTAGLAPVWLSLTKVADGSAVASPATIAPIVAVGGGGYKITYDPSAGEAYGVVDFGPALADPNERYADIYLAQSAAATGQTPQQIVAAALAAQPQVSVTTLLPFGAGSSYTVYYQSYPYPVTLGTTQTVPQSIAALLIAKGLTQ